MNVIDVTTVREIEDEIEKWCFSDLTWKVTKLVGGFEYRCFLVRDGLEFEGTAGSMAEALRDAWKHWKEVR